MNLLVMNVFTNVLDTLLVFYFLFKLLRKKHIDRKSSVMFLTSLIAFNALINLLLGTVNLLGFAAILIVSTIVYSYLLNEKFPKILIYGFLATILMGITEIIVVNAIILVFKITPSMILELNIYRIFAIIGSKLSFYLIIRYLIEKFNIPIYMKIGKIKPIILIGLFNILIIFMTFTLYRYVEIESITGYLYLIGMGFGTIVFSWVIYSTTKKMIYQNQQEIIWKVKEEEFHKTDFYIRNMNDILQTIRSQRHDLGNYLSTLYGLIYLNNFDEAKKYITKINDRISNMNNLIETNHPVITALVSMKKSKAFDAGIDMIFDIDLPEELPFDFVDLSIIIGNLLDNAIEACNLIDKGIERKIELTMGVKKNNLTIQVSNTKTQLIKFEAESFVERFTTKVDLENHGFGLGNIEFVVKQYNGILDIEDLGNRFKVNVDLPMEKDVKYEMESTTYAI